MTESPGYSGQNTCLCTTVCVCTLHTCTQMCANDVCHPHFPRKEGPQTGRQDAALVYRLLSVQTTKSCRQHDYRVHLNLLHTFLRAGVGTQAHLPMNKLLWGGKRGGPGRNRELDAPGSPWECLSHMHSGLVPRALGFWEKVRARASENRQVAESSPKRHRDPKVGQGAGASMWPQGHIYSEQPMGCLGIWIHVGEVGSPAPSTDCGDADWGGQSTGLSEGGDDVTQNQNHTYAKLGSEGQSSGGSCLSRSDAPLPHSGCTRCVCTPELRWTPKDNSMIVEDKLRDWWNLNLLCYQSWDGLGRESQLRYRKTGFWPMQRTKLMQKIFPPVSNT